jgi:uroporphyrinogen III methyltransferase/synthase
MKVYLIGAGPGDPELLTLKARRILSVCDAVVYDDLISKEILAFAAPDARKIHVGKRGGRESMGQDRINDLLVELALQGLAVARLKGGDPCVFGRGGEEALHLARRGVPFEFVPGVSSALAAPQSALIPPTHRGMAASVTLVTAHEDPSKESGFLDWAHLAKDKGTLVFLMGASRVDALAQRLTKEGMDPLTPCAMIQEATLPGQRTLVSTLGSIGREARLKGMSSPSVIVVGKVVDLRSSLFRDDSLPLAGRSVLITRPGNLAYGTSCLFASRGARAVCYPLVEIRGLPFDLSDPKGFDIFIFTSQNAVDLFFSRLFSMGMDARSLGGAEVYCIGPKTREGLARFGIIADGMAEEFRAEGIVELLKGRDLSGRRVCVPRARGARPVLVDELRRMGALVEEIHIYETVMPSDAAPETFQKALDEVDTVVFTSPSGVRNAAALLGGDLSMLSMKKILAIGPVTASALKEIGLKPSLVAKRYTDDGILDELMKEVS